MICQKCGTENKEGSAFCNSCGASLKSFEHVVEPTIASSQPVPPSKKHGILFWVGIIFAVLIVVLIGSAAIAFGSIASTQNSVTSPVTTTQTSNYQNEPIIGSWSTLVDPVTIILNIYPDGHLTEDDGTGLSTAQYTKIQTNVYTVKWPGLVDNTSTFTYHPDTDAITEPLITGDTGTFTRMSKTPGATPTQTITGWVYDPATGSYINHNTPTVTISPSATNSGQSPIVYGPLTITDRTGDCHSDGYLFIDGTITSSDSNSLMAELTSSGYDSTGIKLGSDFTYVNIDPYGTSRFEMIIPNGCPSDGSQGSFVVRLNNYQMAS